MLRRENSPLQQIMSEGGNKKARITIVGVFIARHRGNNGPPPCRPRPTPLASRDSLWTLQPSYYLLQRQLYYPMITDPTKIKMGELKIKD